MRAYGLQAIECPDVADILAMGAASHVGRLREIGGDYRGYCRGESKARARRTWKRRARAEARRAIRQELESR